MREGSIGERSGLSKDLGAKLVLKNPLLLIALTITGAIAVWGIVDTTGLAAVYAPPVWDIPTGALSTSP